MARGDVISNFDVAVSSGSNSAIQPGAGVEWVITGMGAQTADLNFQGEPSGSRGCNTNYQGATTDGGTAQVWTWASNGRMGIAVTNSEYANVWNSHGSVTRYYSFWGFQTK